EADPRWLAFGRQCAQAGQELRQTRGAFLQPPTPRPKARFMNLDTQVQWAARLLRLWPQLHRERLAALLGKTAAEADDWLEVKLLGSSEVIESAFGSFKGCLTRSGWQEIGRNILLLPLLLCQWGVQTVAAALQAVSCQAVGEWVSKELGPSQQSKYWQVLGRRKDPAAGEQKPPPPATPPPETAIPGDGSGRSPPEDRKVA